MKWPLKPKRIPRSRTPFFNTLYLAAEGNGGPDSTIVWTSELDWQPIQDFLNIHNRNDHRLAGTSHLLVQAVGQAMAKHRVMNRRVVGRRIYEFKSCNVCLAARVSNSDEVNVIQIHDADQRLLNQVSHIVWKKQMEFLRGSSPETRDVAKLRRMPGWILRWAIRSTNFLDRWFVLPVMGRVDRLRESAVLINDFSHARFPMMRGYKPSRQPGESKPLSVTLGRPESKVCWENGQPFEKKVAPITVRADHRICDGYHVGQFINSIIELLENPASLDEQAFKKQTSGIAKDISIDAGSQLNSSQAA